ncbi:MAG: hypothetical protein ACI4V7_06920 [Succinivibrionaceae bacterium]
MIDNYNNGSVLQAFIRDFTIYVEENCFQNPDLLEEFANVTAPIFKKYNKQVLINYDFYTSSRKIIAEDNCIKVSLNTLKNYPSVVYHSSSDFESLMLDLRNSGNCLLITQDHERGVLANNIITTDESKDFFVKSMNASAELENFKDIKSKYNSLGNSAIDAVKMDSIIIDLSSLKMEATNWFIEDLLMTPNNEHATVYILINEIDSLSAQAVIAREMEKFYSRMQRDNAIKADPELVNRDDTSIVRKFRQNTNVAVLTFSNDQSGKIYCMNEKDLSGHKVIPFKIVNSLLSVDYSCAWAKDIKKVYDMIIEELSDTIDSFAKYAEMASEKRKDEQSLMSLTSKEHSTEEDKTDSKKNSNQQMVENTVNLKENSDNSPNLNNASNIANKNIDLSENNEDIVDIMDIDSPLESESISVDIDDAVDVINPGLAAQKENVVLDNDFSMDAKVVTSAENLLKSTETKNVKAEIGLVEKPKKKSNDDLLSSILAKNKTAVENTKRKEEIQKAESNKPVFLTSTSACFTISKKQWADLEEAHRKEAEEDAELERLQKEKEKADNNTNVSAQENDIIVVAKESEDEIPIVQKREPKSFKLNGSSIGFNLTPAQQETLIKKREEEQKLKELEQDIKILEEERSASETSSKSIAESSSSGDNVVKLTGETVVFDISKEEREVLENARRLNREAKIAAKKAEYERHKKELEELNREISLIKAIEEYEISSVDEEFVFDPEKDVKESTTIDIEGFNISPEQRDKIRRYEASQRPEVEIKRNLSKASAYNPSDNRQRNFNATDTKLRDVTDVKGFNPTTFSDTITPTHVVKTNIEKASNDYSAINQYIIEKQKSLEENPIQYTALNQTVVKSSETIEIVEANTNKNKADILAKKLDFNTIDGLTNKPAESFVYTGKAFQAPISLTDVKIPMLGDVVKIGEREITLEKVIYLTPHWSVYSLDTTRDIRIMGKQILNDNLVAKLGVMAKNQLTINDIKWVNSLVRNSDGEVVGYVTSKNINKSLNSICRNDSDFLNGKTRLDLLEIAISFVSFVKELHKYNVFLGFEDLNSLCVSSNNLVSLSYVERIQVGDMKYLAGDNSVLAPELVENNTDIASIKTDNYVVAHVLFKLLFQGLSPYVVNLNQGLPIDRLLGFRFPVDAFDEQDYDPNGHLLGINEWSYFPEYVKKSFIQSLYLGYHNVSCRLSTEEWIDVLSKWKEELKSHKLPQKAMDIVANSKNTVSNSDFVNCKACNELVLKDEAELTGGLCHHCFVKNGKIVKCACCGEETIISHKDSLNNVLSALCTDCQLLALDVKGIAKCTKCQKLYKVNQAYLKVFGDKAKECCPDCLAINK